MKKIVEIIAIDNRYKDSTFKFNAAADAQNGVVLTGQHRTSENPIGLTTDQMVGKVKLTDEQKKKYPYVINPDHMFPLWNRRKFDISTNRDGEPVNPKDYAEFIMIRDFSYGVVAPSKSKVKTGTSRFYINDAEAEAKVTISLEDKIYDAQKYVREECSIERYNELAMLLNYKIPNFNIDVKGMSDVMVRQRLYTACKENPDAVLSCKEDGAGDDLFILKAATYGILRKMGDEFYDGPKFIGKGLGGVKAFMNNPANRFYVSKWKTLINEKEGKVNVKEVANQKLEEELTKEYEKLDKNALLQLAINSKYKKIDYQDMNEEELRKFLINKKLKR